MASSSIEEAMSAVKKAIFNLQMALLDGISSDAQLQTAGEVLTQDEYADVVTERSIVRVCGFPLCKKSLPTDLPRKGRYRISLREHKVYDMQETKLFCSSDCLIASRTFAASLLPDRDALADGRKVLELVAVFQNFSITQENRKLIEQSEPHCETRNIVDNESGKELSPTLLIREQGEVHVSGFAEVGPFDAVEGYVPQRAHGKARTIQSNDSSEKTGAIEKIRRKSASNSVRRHEEVDDAEAIGQTLHSYNDRGAGPAENFVSCILVNGETVSAPSQSSRRSEGPGQKPSLRNQKKQPTRHRVSWSDHQEIKESSSGSGHGASDTPQQVRIPESLDVVDQKTLPALPSVSSSEVSRVVEAFTRHESEKAVAGHDVALFADSQKHSVHIRTDRMQSAEAVAAALMEAAAAVASGEAEAGEAVSRAGIHIFSSSQKEDDSLMPFGIRGHFADKLSQNLVSNGSESDHLPEELELEKFDPRECWYSAPPKEFKAELSTFGTIWMALDEWISTASIAYLYGRDATEQDAFTAVNGREYLRQTALGDGVSAEIERTLAGCISRALPGVVEAFRLSVPLSTLEQALGHLLRTMSFREALPPLGTKQWRMIVALLLDALSVERLPLLRSQLANNRLLLRKLLDASKTTEAEYEAFKDLILPLGRRPEFAARCGG